MEGRCIGLGVRRDFCEVAIWQDGELRSAAWVPARPGPLEERNPTLDFHPSRRQLLEHVDVQRLLGHDLLQALVLGLQRLQPLRLVCLHHAVLRAPAIEPRLRDLEVAQHPSTSSGSLFSSRSSSRVFRTAWSCVCLHRLMIVSILSSRQRDMTNTHTTLDQLTETRQSETVVWVSSPANPMGGHLPVVGLVQSAYGC